MKKAVALLLVAALVFAASLTLWGVLADDGPADTAPGPIDTVPATLGEGTGLAHFTEQTITWTACPGGQCAEVTVPLDYADLEGATIELTMLKVSSGRPDAEPLLVNPGGPGGSGMEYAQYSALTLGRTVTSAFDVIGLDPRGVGRSTPVDCLSDDELDAYLAEDPAPDNDAEVAALTRGASDFLAGCRQLSGDLVDHVTTMEAARDMDVVRAVLDQPTLNFFGASYGTKLGATYASLFPQRVGKFVLDGAMDPTLSGAEISRGQAAGFGLALRTWAEDYAQACAKECVLGADADAVLDTVDDLMASIDRTPLPASGRELSGGNAFYGVVMPLYNKEYWPMLTDALVKALDGDGTGLMTNADLYSGRSPSGYVNNSIEANYAINCADDPHGLTTAQVRKQVPLFTREAGVLGSALAWSMAACTDSDAQPTEKPIAIKAAGAAPILVVGTTRDPATPYAWSVALAGMLDSGVLVSRDGDGHTGFQSGNSCVDDTVEDYLLGKKTPAATVTC